MLHPPHFAWPPSCRHSLMAPAALPCNLRMLLIAVQTSPHSPPRQLTDAGVEGGAFLTRLFIRAIEQEGTNAALVGKLLYAAAELGALQVGCSHAAGARAWIQAGSWAVWAAVVC